MTFSKFLTIPGAKYWIAMNHSLLERGSFMTLYLKVLFLPLLESMAEKVFHVTGFKNWSL